MADPVLTREGQVLRFAGPLTLSTVASLLTRGRQLLGDLPGNVTLDLSEVTRVDSAGVALLVELWRLREQTGGSLGFAGIPGALAPLLQLYDLDGLLVSRSNS